MDAQSQEELMVFREFAKACPVSLLPQTARNREPPEPDILCEAECSEPLAFELVTTDDPVALQKIGDNRSLDTKVNALFDDAVAFAGIRDPQRFKGHSVMLVFEDNATLTKRENSLARAIELLNELGPGRHFTRNEKPLKLISCWRNQGCEDERPHIFVR